MGSRDLAPVTDFLEFCVVFLIKSLFLQIAGVSTETMSFSKWIIELEIQICIKKETRQIIFKIRSIYKHRQKLE